MLVTNNTTNDIYFGPLRLPGGGSLTVDDTSDTSLYLTSDAVADAVNNAYTSGRVGVSGAADPFPRPTGTPEILHGNGDPNGLIFAGQGSIYLRRDGSGASIIYVKTTGVTISTGWAFVAGSATQLDFAQITSTTAAINNLTTIVTGNSVTYDGSQVRLEAWAPQVIYVSGSGNTFYWYLFRDSTELCRIPVTEGTSTPGPVFVEVFDTPAAGAHTYAWKAQASSGSFEVAAGAGGTNTLPPAFMRVTKV